MSLDILSALNSISSRLSALEARGGGTATATASANGSVSLASAEASAIPSFSGAIPTGSTSSTPSVGTTLSNGNKLLLDYRGLKTGQRLVMAGNKSFRSQMQDQQAFTQKLLNSFKALVDENGPYASRLTAEQKAKISQFHRDWKANVHPVQLANSAAGGSNNKGQYANEQQYLNRVFRDIRAMGISDVFEVQS